MCGCAHYRSDCPDVKFDEMAGHAGKGKDKGKGKGGKGKTKGDDARTVSSLGGGHAGQPRGGQKGEQKSGKGWKKGGGGAWDQSVVTLFRILGTHALRQAVQG